MVTVDHLVFLDVWFSSSFFHKLLPPPPSPSFPPPPPLTISLSLSLPSAELVPFPTFLSLPVYYLITLHFPLFHLTIILSLLPTQGIPVVVGAQT